MGNQARKNLAMSLAVFSMGCCRHKPCHQNHQSAHHIRLVLRVCLSTAHMLRTFSGDGPA